MGTRLGAARKTIKKCRDQFAFYEAQHRAKGTPDADAKAKVNAGMVAECDKTLARLI